MILKGRKFLINMRRHKIIFLLTFVGTFLIAPIYISTYVGGIELGIESSWKFFGSFMLLYYAFYSLFGQFVSPYGYPSYFGELHFLTNFVFLIFTSLLVARLLTFLFVRVHELDEVSIFWSISYLKKLIRQVIISVIIGIVIFFLTSFILSSTSLINWLYDYTDIRSTMEVAFPITLLASFIALIVQSFKGEGALTKLQKLLLLIESVVFVLGIIGLSIAILYLFLG